MLKNVFAAVRRAQQIVMLFDDVRGVRKCWIEGSYKGYMFRFVDVFGLSNFVTKQIRRAADIPRNLTLQTKDVNKPKRVPFITTFNPALLHISNIIKKHYNLFSAFACCSPQTLPQSS